MSVAAMKLLLALFFVNRKKNGVNDDAIVYFTDRFNPVWT